MDSLRQRLPDIGEFIAHLGFANRGKKGIIIIKVYNRVFSYLLYIP